VLLDYKSNPAQKISNVVSENLSLRTDLAYLNQSLTDLLNLSRTAFSSATKVPQLISAPEGPGESSFSYTSASLSTKLQTLSSLITEMADRTFRASKEI
jgi:hypothetical protein